MNAARSRTFSARHLAVGLAGYCAFINLYSPQSILPLLSQEFHATAAEVSTIITVSTLAVALTAPFTGTVADVLGRKRVIVAAMFVLVIPTLMVALVDKSPAAHLLARHTGAGAAADLRGDGRLYRRRMVDQGGDHRCRHLLIGIEPRRLQRAAGHRLLRRPDRLARGFRWHSPQWRLSARSVSRFLLPPERRFVRSQGLLASGRQMLAHFRNGQLLATYAVGFGVLFNFICTFTFVSFHLAAAPYNLSASWLGAIFVVYIVGSVLTPWTGWAVGRFGRRHFMVGVIAVWLARDRADTGAIAAADYSRPRARRRLRPDLSGGFDRLRHDNRQGRPLIRGRPLCHVLLYRRQFRRGGRRLRLDAGWLVGLRCAGRRDAGHHGGHRHVRLDRHHAPRNAKPDRAGLACAGVPERHVTTLEHGKN